MMIHSCSFHVGSLGTRRDVHTHTLHEAMKVVEYAVSIRQPTLLC